VGFGQGCALLLFAGRRGGKITGPPLIPVSFQCIQYSHVKRLHLVLVYYLTQHPHANAYDFRLEGSKITFCSRISGLHISAKFLDSVVNSARRIHSQTKKRRNTCRKICNSVFFDLSIVCILIKLQRFGSRIFFRLQVKRKDRNPSWNPLDLQL
jgi:hypothetical protein